MKSFLGVVDNFRKYITQCSILAEPLLLLTRGQKNLRIELSWGEYQQTSFEALKACFLRPQIRNSAT